MKLSLSILALVSADARLRRESVIVGDDGKWNKCEAQLSDMDVNGEIKCEAEVCSVLCMPGFMVEGPAKAKCVKGKNGEWSFNKDLGVCVEDEDDMTDDMEGDYEDKPEDHDEDHEDKPDMEDHEDKPDHDDYEDKPEDHEDHEDKPDEDDGDMNDDDEKPDMNGEKPDMEDMPDVFGDDGKWNKCEVESVDMGKIKCEAEKCMLYCMEGFMVEGNGKAKCEKNKKGEWGFNKEFGSCVECGDDCPEVEMPDMEKPDHEDEEKPMCEEGEECEEGEKPEKPMCDDEDEECEEKPEKPMCDENDETDDCDYEEKPDHDDEKPMCDEGEECEEKPDMDGEKPDMEDMPDVFGDDGKWNKCEIEPVDMGKIKCEADKCMLYCMEGFMVEGNGKAKCEKNKKGEWGFNKEFGTCVECGDDCPEVEMPEMPEKPEDDEKPEDEEEKPEDEEEKPEDEEDKPEDDEEAGEAVGVSGDEGKWQKCEPEPVENGQITCMDVKCGLDCEEGFMVEGNAKAKCEKNKKGIWKFNKPLGTCVEAEDKPEDDEDKPEDEDEENEEPVDEVENPGCKNLDDMIPEDSGLEIGCKVNGKQQFICKLECPEGTNFMGKDGKTGTKLTCKCKGETCKWQNDAGKTVNGKKMKSYGCE